MRLFAFRACFRLCNAWRSCRVHVSVHRVRKGFRRIGPSMGGGQSFHGDLHLARRCWSVEMNRCRVLDVFGVRGPEPVHMTVLDTQQSFCMLVGMLVSQCFVASRFSPQECVIMLCAALCACLSAGLCAGLCVGLCAGMCIGFCAGLCAELASALACAMVLFRASRLTGVRSAFFLRSTYDGSLAFCASICLLRYCF